jgi:hypothetical protein
MGRENHQDQSLPLDNLETTFFERLFARMIWIKKKVLLS